MRTPAMESDLPGQPGRITFGRSLLEFHPITFCFPLANWVFNPVLGKPFLCPSYEMEQTLVGWRLRKLRFAFSCFNPTNSDPRIGVDHAISISTVLQQRQSMHNRKELTDIYRAIFEWPLVKQVYIAFNLDTLVFERPRISFACSIDCDRREIHSKFSQVFKCPLWSS